MTTMVINHDNTTDESEVSDSSTNARISFRVSVCLRRYFKDHRARCYMQVTRNQRVRWLEKRIQKVFSLPQNFCLCSNGHLLPFSEPLALLEPGDSIEVIPLKEKVLHGNFNGTSDTTQPLISEISKTQNIELVLDTENINQNSKSVWDKNYTKINSSIGHNKNVELVTHMEIDQSDSTSSLNNQKHIHEQGKCDETDGAMETLQLVKKHALQLLKEECGEGLSERPRRVRKRVRRRPRRPTSPASTAAATPPSLAPAPRIPHLRFSSPPITQKECPALTPCSSPLEVERNEEVSERLPRVIRPLDDDE